jgi:hypothetical protein
MLVIFLDLEKASDRAMRDKYEAEGKPQCLIAKKNVKYFDEHVAPYKQAFLTFFVKGAMVFYEKSGIQIPQSLNDYQCKAVSNKAVLVTEYIEDNLETWHGTKLLERDIYADFKKVTGTDALVLNATAFYKQLKSAIDGKSGGGDWADVKNYNGRDGSCRKDANGKDNISKGQLYENLTFKNRMKAPWHVSDQASEQKSRKRKTESETGGQATRPSENSADVREKNKLSTIPPQDLPLALPLEDYAAVLPPHPTVLSQFDLQGVAEYIRTKDCRNVIVMAGAGISIRVRQDSRLPHPRHRPLRQPRQVQTAGASGGLQHRLLQAEPGALLYAGQGALPRPVQAHAHT